MEKNVVVVGSSEVLERDALFFGLAATGVGIADVMTAFEAALIREDASLHEEIIESKKRLLRSIISKQVEEKGYFELNPTLPNTCPTCVGAGERYKFVKQPVLDTCPQCKGDGKVEGQCTSCSGTGRFRRKMVDGREIEVQCKGCKGTGKSKVRCSKCAGRGQIRKFIITSAIESTTPCERCKGVGLRKVKEAENPVITPEQAKKITANA